MKTTDKITIPKLQRMKDEGRKITMLTCYDYSFAKILNTTGIDVILVGDSLGTVVQGHKTTIPVTIDDVVYHARAVARALTRPLLVADMPFMSYQSSVADAMKNAGKLMKKGGAESVKLEGGKEIVLLIKKMVDSGIPVAGHIGIQPQSIHKAGGYKIKGKNLLEEERLLSDAEALEDAGAWGIILEGVSTEVSRKITKKLSIPTIGIAAGPHCDGQVLVLYDLLGMDKDFNPKFLKKYANLNRTISRAVKNYLHDVRSEKYPDSEHSFTRDLKSVKTYSN